MDDRMFDRWAASVAQRGTRPTRRRLLAGGLVGGLLAGALGTGAGASNLSRRTQTEPECSLGCTDSTCGQVPQGCALFPPDNIWNTPVDTLPVSSMSDAWVASMAPDSGLHPDFGAGLYEGSPLGIPFVRVPVTQPAAEVAFEIAEESDPGSYPIPPDAPVEGGSCADGDRHVIVVQEGSCLLYELFSATQAADGSWQAYAGARFDLTSNALRPASWTSADAAGLPILPGLVRYEEIAAGVIPHALRFTTSTTQEAYIWPARHQAGSTIDTSAPPMGQRFRLKASVDTGDFSPTNQIILQALRTYGMMLADNGSDWFLSGAPDDRWDNDDLRDLQERIHGSDFEAVDCSALIVDPDSGQAA